MTSKFEPVIELPLPVDLTTESAPSVSDLQTEVLALFDECGPRLRRYITSFGLTTDVADDVVQEVFLSLFRHLKLGRPRHNLRGWLFQVAHNLALKQRQRGARRRMTEGAWDMLRVTAVVDTSSDPEGQLVEAEQTRRLRLLVRRMPSRDRQCLFLRSEGLRYREIASTLGISLGSVAKSLTRALASLTRIDEV